MAKLDGPLSWMVCFCSALCSLITFGCSYTFGILFPAILDEFQAGKAVTAFVGSFALAVFMLFAPLSGKLCDLFGCRRVVFAGGLLCALGLLGASFSPNVPVLYITYGLIFGIGSSSINIAAFVITPPHFHKHRSLAIAIVGAGPGTGLLIMSPVVQALMESLGWRKTLLTLSGITFIPSLLSWTYFKRTDNKDKPIDVKPEEQMDDLLEHRTDVYVPRKKFFDFSFLRNPVYILNVSAEVVKMLGHVMPVVHLAKYSQEVGIPSTLSFWIYFTIGLSSGLVFRPLAGKLCDTRWFNPQYLYQAGMLPLVLGNLLLPQATSFTALLVYAVAYGMGDGVTASCINCIIINCLPLKLQGQGIGTFIFFLAFPFIAAPPLAGLIADLTGSYHPAFYTAAALEIAGACIPFLQKLIKTPVKTATEVMMDEDSPTELERFLLRKEHAKDTSV